VTLLDEARTAYHRLMTGVAVVRVEVDGQIVQYTQQSVSGLSRYIRELENECGSGTSGAVSRKPIRFAG